jgi:hypothetical protein
MTFPCPVELRETPEFSSINRLPFLSNLRTKEFFPTKLRTLQESEEFCFCHAEHREAPD